LDVEFLRRKLVVVAFVVLGVEVCELRLENMERDIELKACGALASDKLL